MKISLQLWIKTISMGDKNSFVIFPRFLLMSVCVKEKKRRRNLLGEWVDKEKDKQQSELKLIMKILAFCEGINCHILLAPAFTSFHRKIHHHLMFSYLCAKNLHHNFTFFFLFSRFFGQFFFHFVNGNFFNTELPFSTSFSYLLKHLQFEN